MAPSPPLSHRCAGWSLPTAAPCAGTCSTTCAAATRQRCPAPAAERRRAAAAAGRATTPRPTHPGRWGTHGSFKEAFALLGQLSHQPSPALPLLSQFHYSYHYGPLASDLAKYGREALRGAVLPVSRPVPPIPPFAREWAVPAASCFDARRAHVLPVMLCAPQPSTFPHPLHATRCRADVRAAPQQVGLARSSHICLQSCLNSSF